MNTPEQKIETAELVERLREAHQNSPQRIAGSDIFEDAADCIEALSEAVDALSEIAESRGRTPTDDFRPSARAIAQAFFGDNDD